MDFDTYSIKAVAGYHCTVCHNDWNTVNEQCPCLEVTSWLQSSTWRCWLDINVWNNIFSQQGSTLCTF